jgi:hypothetical protein
LNLVAIGFEISGVTFVQEGRELRASPGRSQRDNTGGRVRAVEHSVGSPIDLEVLEASGGDVAEVEAAAEVLDGDAIHHDAIRRRAASADEERGFAADLPGLHDVHARHLAERVDDVRAVGKIGRVQFSH